MFLALMACRPAPPPPNVLLISIDTLRADVVGAYGNRAGASPTLDALASEGVLFDRAYTVTPLTIPAHSSLFTGKYPPNHGVQDNGAHFLGGDELTLAEVFDAKGYATMAAVGAEVTSHHWGFDQGFDTYFDDLGARDASANRWRVERGADEVVDDALSWLTEAREEPTFSWVHVFDVHAPYAAPQPFRSQYSRRPYLGELAWTDSQIARLLDGVDLDNTWVIVTGDHGEGLGSNGEQFHGVLLYDATMRVPLIIRPPGGTAPLVVTEAVSIVDIAPTILALLGHELPGVDGADLSGVFSGEPAPTRSVYLESLYAFMHYGWAPQRAVADAEWKYFEHGELHGRGAESRDQSSTEPEVVANLSNDLSLLQADFEPPTEVETAQLEPERIAQLAALGYLTAVANVEESEDLPDPRDKMPVLREVETMRAALQSEDFEEARVIGERLVADEPGLVEPKSLLVVTLSRLGDLEGALAAAEALESSNPTAQSATSLASVRMAMGDSDEGILSLRTAIERDPYLASPRVLLGRALFQQGNAPELARATEDAYALLPEVPEVVGLRGLALVMSGDDFAGEPMIRSALESEPGQPMLNHGLGILANKRGDKVLAETHFLAEIESTAPAIPSRRKLVELYAADGRYVDQLEQLEHIAAVETPHPLTLHSIAQAHFNMQAYDEAAIAVGECRSLAPAYPGCAMLEANVLKKQGRDAEATAAYEEALRLAAQTPE